jgi:diaminobutyrate-2-oxoglutarate transaminase
MEVGEDQVLSQLISYLDDGRVAGVVVETVQGEGGVRPISSGFLQQAARLIQSAGSLLIVDDVQAGCGRTGNFFSFEDLDVVPDMVCLSKSLSGIGFPLGVVLLKGGVDCWEPGEYTGTFRGAGLSFVTAACALRTWWEDDSFSNLVKERGRLLRIRLEEALVGTRLHVRGRGMFLGIVGEPGDGADLSRRMFDLRVVAESCGADEEVLKLLPSLNASPEFIEEFLGILKTVVVDFT